MVFVRYGSVFVHVSPNRLCKIDESPSRTETEEMKKTTERVRKYTHPNETENGNTLLKIIANKEIARNVDNGSGNVHLKANDKIIYKLDSEEQ